MVTKLKPKKIAKRVIKKQKGVEVVNKKKVAKAKRMVTKIKPGRPIKKKKHYYETVGRRKTAVARVRLFTVSPSLSAETGNFLVNGKPYREYFFTPELQTTVEAALKRLKSFNRFGISVRVRGGGLRAQAEAVRHGIARALILFDPNFRKKLKRAGYLIRDPRMKERKKYGLKKARRAPQWRKR